MGRLLRDHPGRTRIGSGYAHSENTDALLTTDPFVIYTSNIFAVLGLRALYVLLARAMDHFRHLHSGLALILLFGGVKMVASGVYEVPIGASLGVIVGILVAGVE